MGRFSRSEISVLESLVERALRLSTRPPDPVAMLALQEDLVARIRLTERRIKEARAEIATGRRRFSSERGMSIAERASLRRRSDSAQRTVTRNKDKLRILRLVGDTIAFRFIDVWDIKPLAFKEGPGFLTGSVGARQELRFLRYLARRGTPAILNDLTTSLRYGDITSVGGIQRGFQVHEIKAGRQAENSRAKRQLKKLAMMASYFRTDLAPPLLHGMPGPMTRSAAHARPRYNTTAIRRAARAATLHGVGGVQPEPGLVYFAATVFNLNHA